MGKVVEPLTLHVDLGGTKVEAALVDTEGHAVGSPRQPQASESASVTEHAKGDRWLETVI